jgi:flagellar protein FlaG
MMEISQAGSSNFNSPTLADPIKGNVVVPDVVKTSAAVIEIPAKAVQAVGETVDPSLLKQAAERLNQAMRMMAVSLDFQVDEDTGIHVVKVLDTDTKEVIRQFPSEEILAIAKAFDTVKGLLVRDKA